MQISIIIPVYNVEKYLVECLESIIFQSQIYINEIEILLIDDGSTDSSGLICDQYQNRNSNLIKVYHKQNEGLLLTRRYGYRMSTGKYIINCDSDDCLEPDMIKTIKDTIDTYEPDVILYNANVYQNNQKLIFFENVFSIEGTEAWIGKKQVLSEFLHTYSIASMCCKCFKRDCLDISMDYTNYRSISNGEDTLQSLEIFTKAKSFFYVNKSFYNYRIASGMTSKFDANYFESFKKIVMRIKDCKRQWQLENFDEYLAVKLFSSTGRAITQSRYGNINNREWHIAYLKNMEHDPLIVEYRKYFCQVKKYLQKNHIVLIWLLLNKRFWLIHILLKAKNCFAT